MKIYSFEKEGDKHILTVSDIETGDVTHQSEHDSRDDARDKMCALKRIPRRSEKKKRWTDNMARSLEF